MFIPSVLSPSILLITSPARSPMRDAGVPSIGVITVSWPLRMPTRMPRPWKLERWRSRMLAYASRLRKLVCGSSVRIMPLIDDVTRSS